VRKLTAFVVRITLFAVSCAILLPQSKAQLVPLIEKAVVNSTAGTVTIEGSGFATSKKPTVFLGGVQLTVTSFSATTIVASTAAVTTPGSYLLVVNDDVLPGLFEVTLGAVGPQGAMGLQGPIGPAGATGAAGSIGPIGPAGPAGTTGAAGPIGPAGPAGATGATGAIGPAGATGAAGPIGPAGATGATGAIGPAGATGSIGPAGATGATGATGPMGLIGNPGPAGATGATGAAGPAGGQIWSANFQLPASIASFSNQVIAAASGASIPASDGDFPSFVLPLPEACTVSKFSVTVFGAANTSQATFLLTASAASTVAAEGLNPTGISCTVTANDGAPVSCTSATSVPLSAGVFLADAAIGFTNSADFDNARATVSFVCE